MNPSDLDNKVESAIVKALRHYVQKYPPPTREAGCLVLDEDEIAEEKGYVSGLLGQTSE
jgi:hypothetical protein